MLPYWFWGSDKNANLGFWDATLKSISENPASFLAATVALLVACGGAYKYLVGRGKAGEPKRPPTIVTNSQTITNNPIPIKDESDGTITLTVEGYEKRLREREREVTDRLQKATGTELAELNNQKAELERRLSDIGPAFDQAKHRIEELETLLEREGNYIGAERLQRAEKALAEGDFDDADALLAEISAEEDLAVQRKARAEFGRGKIAEQQVRWHDAAEHFGNAARLEPSYENLSKAQRFAQLSGDYTLGLSLGKDALEAALAEYGEDSRQHSDAINNLAINYSLVGQNERADPLFRQAIEINKATIGETHPNYATALNNLAELLKETGRYEEAEPLYRQAIEIDSAALGEQHPGYATDLNNLAILLKDTGRYDEAEPLFRQAIEIIKITIGEAHPNYAGALNNLAGLLRVTGRYGEAETPYRQAIEIGRAALGDKHPSLATDLNNLSALYFETDRIDEARPLIAEALAIFRQALGDNHPDTMFTARNYARLLRKHFPDDPELAELEAAFGPEIGVE